MRKDVLLVASRMLMYISILSMTLQGCTKNANPVAAASPSGPAVGLAVSFSKQVAAVPLSTAGGTLDSVRIDSAVVVVQNVTFLATTTSSGHDGHGEGEGGGGGEAGLTFRGPFVVRILDTLGIDLASQFLPAGTYTGIRFETHSLLAGEHHEDGDDHRHNRSSISDSSFTGSSVMVWGAVLKNGDWISFAVSSNIETEIEINKNFVIPANSGVVKFAMNFNLGLLFRNPMTGTFIDPTDASMQTKELLALAIQNAFGQGRGGEDHNGDGHPDD